jgi:hypothetical protein
MDEIVAKRAVNLLGSAVVNIAEAVSLVRTHGSDREKAKLIPILSAPIGTINIGALTLFRESYPVVAPLVDSFRDSMRVHSPLAHSQKSMAPLGEEVASKRPAISASGAAGLRDLWLLAITCLSESISIAKAESNADVFTRWRAAILRAMSDIETELANDLYKAFVDLKPTQDDYDRMRKMLHQAVRGDRSSGSSDTE